MHIVPNFFFNSVLITIDQFGHQTNLLSADQHMSTNDAVEVSFEDKILSHV